MNSIRFLRKLEGWKKIGDDVRGETVGDQSGASVSLSADGSTLAIGAPYNSEKGYVSGHAAVFRFSGNRWLQIGADIDGEASTDQSGVSVSLSSDGSTLAVGAPFNDGNGNASGSTCIFKFDGRNWNQMGSDIDGEAATDYSGKSVSLSGDGLTVAIGAAYNNGNGNDSGHTRVFKFDGQDWKKIGEDIDGEMAGDFSGHSVSLSSDGKALAIGAIWNDGNGYNSGHTRVFRFDGKTWNKLGSDINGEGEFDYSGWSVSLSGSGFVVAIGAIFNGDSSGHCRVFEFDGEDWSQRGSDIDGEAAEDLSGASVSLSANGSTVAIGASRNNGNGYNSGHARVFNFDGQSWYNVFEADGEAPYDTSGKSVSLSSDGLTLAVGASANGDYSGHVRIYRTEMMTEIKRAIAPTGICTVPDRSNSKRTTECTNARDKAYEESISLFQSDFENCDCSGVAQFATVAKEELLGKAYKEDPENSTRQEKVKICARDGVRRYIKVAVEACIGSAYKKS